MARRFLPRALTTALDSFLLAPSEVAYDQDLDRIRQGNGVDLGGKTLLNADDGEAIALMPPHTYAQGTDATAILQATADRARAMGAAWKLRNGVTYTVFGTVTTYTSLDLGDCTVKTSNTGQDGAVFKIAPLDEDVELVSLATANTWTMVKDSAIIPELAGQRGWTYTIDGGDIDIRRSTGNHRRQQQTFTVISDDGQISTPLRVKFTQPFNVNTVITRQRMKGAASIRNGQIRVTSSTGSNGRNRLMETTRSNSYFENISIFNEQALEISQGFVHEKCERVLYQNCDVQGLHSVATNYAWNGNVATDITFSYCYASGGRRNIDAHGCCDYRVIGGNFSDGIGGHWLHGLYLAGFPSIGCSNPNNPYCIQMAGSDLIGAANFQLDSGFSQAVKIRGDIFEFGGTIDLRGSVFTIDNSRNQIGSMSAHVYLVRLAGPNGDYDTGRPVSLPSSIDLTDITIKLIGDCRFFIYPLEIGSGTSTGFPQNIMFEGAIRIAPKLVNVPAVVSGALGGVNEGLPSVRVNYIRDQTSIGAGYDIDISGIPNLRFYADAPVVNSPTAARARVRISDLDTSFITARYGAVKSMKLIRSAAPATVQISDGTNAAVGDERYYFYATSLTVATDADFTVYHGRVASRLFHTGTLTANRTVTLGTDGAAEGDSFEFTRSGAGAFNLSIGGLATLATKGWCKVTYRSGAWVLAQYGTLP